MCGESNIFCLEFHHKENEIKENILKHECSIIYNGWVYET